MNRVELIFNKAETRLAGFPYGREVYEKQVKNYINVHEEIEIVFPNQIEKVASSFVQGFFSDLISKIGYLGIEKHVKIIASSEKLSKMIKKNIY